MPTTLVKSDPTRPISTDESLEQYREFVANVAARADATVILNRDHMHASVVVAQLFAASNHEMIFLTGNLNSAVYGGPDVVGAALEFLRRSPNARIRVLHELPLEMHNELVSAICSDDFKSRVSFTQVPTHLVEGYNCHFAVGDAVNLRFEESRDAFEAMVRFGDHANARKLVDFFDFLERKAKALNLNLAG